MISLALYSLSRLASKIAWWLPPPIPPAIPRSAWLSSISPINAFKNDIRLHAIIIAATHACARGPSSLRESLADQLSLRSDGRAYELFRGMRDYTNRAPLPPAPSQIGFSLWATMFLEARISSSDEFSEATCPPPETHRSFLPLLRSARSKRGSNLSQEDLAAAVGIIFVAEAIERPDLLREGQDYMTAWAKRLSSEAVAIAESISIKEAIVLAPGDSSLPATGLRRTLRL